MCDQITNAPDINELSDLCKVQVDTAIRDVSQCDKNMDKNDCLMLIATTLSDDSVCDKIEDLKVRDQCHNSIPQ